MASGIFCCLLLCLTNVLSLKLVASPELFCRMSWLHASSKNMCFASICWLLSMLYAILLAIIQHKLTAHACHMLGAVSHQHTVALKWVPLPKQRQAACPLICARRIAGADRVLAMDLHSGQCVGYFDIPVDHVYGDSVILDYLASKHISTGDLVVVSPDVGGVARARAFAKKVHDVMRLSALEWHRRPMLRMVLKLSRVSPATRHQSWKTVPVLCFFAMGSNSMFPAAKQAIDVTTRRNMLLASIAAHVLCTCS